MNASSQALLVPLNVLAFAVNEQDAHDATPYFSGANSVFTEQSGERQAFLGANVNRSLMAAPAQPLGPGVHLHWALPDALTTSLPDRGVGALDFPIVPNRWLVQRLLIVGGQATRSSWVVLSDLLNAELPAGQTSVSLPTHPDAQGQNYQYSGEYQPFDSAWVEPPIASGRAFSDLAGIDLTAVANGHSTFASFYPNCRGVFGFADSLGDLNLAPGAAANLMYVVTGWYADPDHDPLKRGMGLDQLQAALRWSFADTADGARPDHSLYHGVVQNIVWHPDLAYLTDYSVARPQIALDISLGNNLPEAMSAYLQNKLQPDMPYFQAMLAAYFDGLLDKLKQPAPSQLATLAEELHEQGFGAIKAEYLYAIVPDIAPGGSGLVAPGDGAGAGTALPARVGDALNLLNTRAQAVQLLQESLTYAQWQLFANWYRIFMSSSTDQQQAYAIAFAQYQSVAQQASDVPPALAALEAQRAIVAAQVPDGMVLRKVPAPCFWQANDPAFLVGGKDMPPMNRYGKNGQYDPNGYLVCRLAGQLVTRSCANGVAVDASNFAACALPLPNALPSPDAFNALLMEALLLNASLLSSMTGADIRYADVVAAVGGQAGALSVSGSGPSLIGMSNWDGNPWTPAFAQWELRFQPVFSTTDASNTALYDYPDDFFTSQFTIEQNAGGAIGFAGAASLAGAGITQTYRGAAILSRSAVDGFARQLDKSKDPLLQECLQAIRQDNAVMQSLSGLTSAFLMQEPNLELNIAVPDGAEYWQFTRAVAAAVGGFGSGTPNFNSFYNPLRAGYFTLGLTLIDLFGQQKTVKPLSFSVAPSLCANGQGPGLPGVAFLPPRISQASRLLFRFVSADSSALAEMNAHPATTPVCGWLLPNHLDGSLFIYDAQGASLGTLYQNDARTATFWQSAPGNNATIGLTAEQVMAGQQPQLQALVLSLKQGSAAFFKDFMTAIDNVNALVEPQSLSTNNDLAVLIGRPMALVQAALSLELMGTPKFNQSWSVLGLPDPLAQTENGFTQVKLPVVLGNMRDLDDGLIGYFTASEDAYDLSSFYTMGAPANATGGVRNPAQDTITVTPYPGTHGASAASATRKILMLIDPRAQVHATTGILPTVDIALPSDLYASTLAALEMTFLSAPLLSGASSLKIPLPAEAGYQWSWIQERRIANTRAWVTDPDPGAPAPPGLWTYTPQTVREGWLRINPELLAFDVYDSSQKAILQQGINDGLTLVVTNRQGRPVTFSAGELVPEGAAGKGAVFYLHFGNAVPQAAVAAITLQAPGWQFACFTDALYGSYWAAAALQDVVLAADASMPLRIDHLEISTDKQQITVLTDYYRVLNDNDGVYPAVLSIAQS